MKTSLLRSIVSGVYGTVSFPVASPDLLIASAPLSEREDFELVLLVSAFGRGGLSKIRFDVSVLVNAVVLLSSTKADPSDPPLPKDTAALQAFSARRFADIKPVSAHSIAFGYEVPISDEPQLTRMLKQAFESALKVCGDVRHLVSLQSVVGSSVDIAGKAACEGGNQIVLSARARVHLGLLALTHGSHASMRGAH